MLSRRDFVKTSLRGASLFAMAPAVPGFLAATARAAAPVQDGRVLVVVQLDGGNDGINTVVPYKDEGYAKNRKALRLPPISCIKVNDAVGLHPSLTGAAKLLERGGWRSCRASAIPTRAGRTSGAWRSGRPRRDPEEHGGPGWLGRAFDERLEAGDASGTTFVGTGQPPAALIGRRSIPATLERLDDLALKGGPGARGDRRSSGGRRRRRVRPPDGARRLHRRRQRGRDDPRRRSGGWGIGQ